MSTEDTAEPSFEEALAAADAAMGEPAAPAPVAPPPPAPAQPPVAVTLPPPAASAPPGPAAIPQYILDREAALEARERATREAESRAREIEQRAKSLEAREAAVANAAEEFEANPVAFAKKLRPDLSPAQAAKWAEHFYAHALGREAPPELRLESKIVEIDRNARQANERLNKQLEDMQRQAAQREQAEQVAAYRASLKAAVSNVPPDAVYLSHLAKSDPDQFAKELYEEAVRDVEAQWAADQTPRKLEPAAVEELAKRAEARIKAQVEKYAPPSASAANARQAPPVAITSRVAAQQPPRSEPDPDSDEALRAAALKAIGRDDLIGTW